MIRNGEITPGQAFPSERALSQQFGVSRNTVREALRHFIAIGVASSKQRSGTYLVDDQESLQRVLAARQIMEQYNLAEMIQARRVLEVGIVRIAAENANRYDKISLRKMLEQFDMTTNDVNTDEGLQKHLLADYNFHREIARTTHNTMLVELQATMKPVILAAANIWRVIPDKTIVANPAHKFIVDAIADNNPARAVEAMERHLLHMEQLMEISHTVELSHPK